MSLSTLTRSRLRVITSWKRRKRRSVSDIFRIHIQVSARVFVYSYKGYDSFTRTVTCFVCLATEIFSTFNFITSITFSTTVHNLQISKKGYEWSVKNGSNVSVNGPNERPSRKVWLFVIICTIQRFVGYTVIFLVYRNQSEC